VRRSRGPGGADGRVRRTGFAEPGALDVVHVNTTSSTVWLESDIDADHYNALFERITRLSLAQRSSVRLIDGILKEMQSTCPHTDSSPATAAATPARVRRSGPQRPATVAVRGSKDADGPILRLVRKPCSCYRHLMAVGRGSRDMSVPAGSLPDAPLVSVMPLPSAYKHAALHDEAVDAWNPLEIDKPSVQKALLAAKQSLRQ
jgi:hypothetical protein